MDSSKSSSQKSALEMTPTSSAQNSSRMHDGTFGEDCMRLLTAGDPERNVNLQDRVNSVSTTKYVQFDHIIPSCLPLRHADGLYHPTKPSTIRKLARYTPCTLF
jgi:hypothetical protein